MKSAYSFGLATLVFVMTMSFCPAAQAWQSGRWTAETQGGASATTPQLARAISSSPRLSTRSGGSVVAATTSSHSARVPSGRGVTMAATTGTSTLGATSTEPAAEQYVALRERHRERRPTAPAVTPQPAPSADPSPSPSSDPTQRPAPTQSPTAEPTPSASPAPTLGAALNIKSFGAKGDGTTDDRAAIVAAFGKARPGDTLYFPAGTYFCSANTWLALPAGVNITGAGIGSTWLGASLKFNSDSTITGLEIGQKEAGIPAVSNKAGATATTFDHVRFRGGGKTYAPVILLGGCRGSHNSCSFITFKYSEVERNLGVETNPPSKNLNDITLLSSYLAGESCVHDITFDHDHVGVSNGQGGWDTGSPRMALEAWPDFSNGSGGHVTIAQAGQKPWYNVRVTNSVFEATDWSVLDFSDQVSCDNQSPFAYSATGVLVSGNTLAGAGHRWPANMGRITFEGPSNSTCSNNTIHQGGALGSAIQIRSWEVSHVALSANTLVSGYGTYVPSPFDP